MDNDQALKNIESTSLQITGHDRVPLPPYGFAKRNKIVILSQQVPLKVACTSETSIDAIMEVQRYCMAPVNIELMSGKDFESALRNTYDANSEKAAAIAEGFDDSEDIKALAESLPKTEDLLESEDDAPIIKLINAMITEATKQNASDIHIETYQKHLSVRYRIDGILRNIIELKRELAPLLVSRIKVMSKLDIAEKRTPQDGRISLRISGRDIDIRVSTLPSSNGERVVLRLLDKQVGRLQLPRLGMQKNDEARLSELLHKPHGIILVTGPTGSGKTTTLYAGLSHINSEEKNILTVEDPIEYQLDGIGQTQVNLKTSLTFEKGLRAILRQDPDVVMIGEIRDRETAEIAIQASLTGHLVLSTLHTNTAIGAITRLEDMGVESFLLASSLAGILAQRLVRVLCDQCKTGSIADQTEREILGIEHGDPPIIYQANGCDTCNHTGYSGRTGIYELIVIEKDLQKMIHDHSSENLMLELARRSSRSIRQDGQLRVLSGITTLDEVVRVTQRD